MAGGLPLVTWLPLFLTILGDSQGQVLNPPYFNLAENRKIWASATCGEGVFEPELYCKLVGANTDGKDNPNIIIQGQVCDYCNPNDPRLAHPPENAIDGTVKWWQSPPLSRGSRYNEVNLTIDLGQEFHVAYVFIKMGNSPRPGVWILERSTDNGTTYNPWQYFADTPSDCVQRFGPDSLQPLIRDDSVICETKFSKVVPLEGGEIVVSLLNDRPNADNFSYSPVLQEWTKATNIRLRFLRTKTLLGHLMSVARQDPTVTRRYFYSIKDINIGGRCVCNGHADTCDLTDPNDPYRLLCRCQHNSCGPQCDRCCPGYLQKKWRRAIIANPFVCESCNCFEHSDECIYDEETDRQRLSLDIHGVYEGGGVCQNCKHNTQGINCNQCKPTFYRPYGKLLNATDVCQPCNCDTSYSTGNCADGNGQCECRREYLPPNCDDCSLGYYGYPLCRPCDCSLNGTHGNVCEVGGGQCPCKANYAGKNCDQCRDGYYGYPNCLPCDCHYATSVGNVCDKGSGQCTCKINYGGRRCDRCQVGSYNWPGCEFCSCDPKGCLEEICNNVTGECLCRPGFGGPRCDRCAHGHYFYPTCSECQCNEQGSLSTSCDNSGRCSCLRNYAGLKCDHCAPGYYNFPECLPCDCDHIGSNGITCNREGQCVCHVNFDGIKCDRCKEGFYNYPLCEECNCNPAGVLATFQGCGSLTSGELCECKERVTGRICNECKPLYWNLKASNLLGCEDCNCFLDGTVGGIGACEKTTGQCMCKPNVGSRQCMECIDGSYNLDRNDLFGCRDCGCDIGGSVNNICDKRSGQCACRPRITGRECNEPLQIHYFPTLFQHQFEIEDGRTPVGTQVRYGYEETVFPGFSWRGYAVFSDIQKEVLLDIKVEKPSLYQVFLRYLNFGGENIFGTITFTPETFGDIQQSSDMVFEATSKPKFMRVSGKQGLIASPFVLNPGRWMVSIRIEKPMFLDYMVLLPQSYYEATLLQEDVNMPCSLNGNDHEACRNFRYPSLPPEANIVRGEAGYIANGDERMPTNRYKEEALLQILNTRAMAWLEGEQNTLHLDTRVTRPGAYIVIITYHTPEGGRSTTATVEVTTSNLMEKGKAVFYDCTYAFLCRQVVVDHHGKVAVFNLDSNFASVILEAEEYASLAIDSIALVPADLWHADYIVPESLCVSRSGSCIESVYLPVPESTKAEFESGLNEDRIAVNLPKNIIDTSVGLIYLDRDDPMVDLDGSVPVAGIYTFVVHYYQPDYPRYDAQVIIQNGQFYEAVLPLAYCPSASGCRAVIHAQDTGSTSFQILENYVLSIKQPNGKSVWVDYVLAIPSNQFHESFLHPLRQDKAGKFITECGQNSFYLSTDVKGFCREAAFSLTSEYNNGALSCQCNTDGSLSYECEEFGGQCLCRPNVIGRTCSQCRTGFFGFPNCQPCDCPSTAYCHQVTGQCICPPRVTGDRCDTCVPYTYGFDSIIGCEECNCNPSGVQGNLQCDLQTGQCRCKSNIVGRTCDKCKPGYWAFPYCQLCNCDLRGSTEDICEQDTARCHCKENVYGDSCVECKPGTFYLEESNPLGCTKCFCFGTTDRCSSAYLFRTQVLEMDSWEEVGVDLDNDLIITEVDGSIVAAGDTVQAVLSSEMPSGILFYFSAPEAYLGNKLTSYGGVLSYKIFNEANRDTSSGSFVGPDVILVGNNISIVHYHVEQPAAGIPLDIEINLLEREFVHQSGSEVTREQLMMVLVNLNALLIRGSYFHKPIEMRLIHVLLDVAEDSYVADAPQALRVEQCQCHPSYRGYSCEECAPGYYRAKTGPYLGYCVPCQCNNHAHSCDVNTGKCFDCRDNTVGDHCEMCGPGYHGVATQGTPYDCLICACPLPFETNNFAESCEVSPSGLEISCVCKPGYFGPRCEVCAAGFFGQPEELDSYCQPCQCSGNIDATHPGSCDSVTGDCVLCLNNTFGTACEICAPGYYGDAINRKNCRSCTCDECGTDHCDHETGHCVCQQNVEGHTCDRCSVNHWGFDSCRGCRHCNCGPAALSDQCDVETGKCKCKPGAGGLTCDICEPGFWRYTHDGCISCNCDEKYSAGAVCNAVSGQCQCLPGVVGEKCDRCPYRWVFIHNQGCLECGPCVHALLDETDALQGMIDPVMFEMRDVSTTYFAYRRLHNVNKTVDTLRLGVDALILDPTGLDFSPLVLEVQDLEKKSDYLDRNAAKSDSRAKNVATDADTTRKDALDMEKEIRDTIAKTNEIVAELEQLSEGLITSTGPSVDHLIAEAEYMLDQIKSRDFEPQNNATVDEMEHAKELLDRVKAFESPVQELKGRFEDEKESLSHLLHLLEELNNHSRSAYAVAHETQSLTKGTKAIAIEGILDTVDRIFSESRGILDEAHELLDKAKRFVGDARDAFEKLAADAKALASSLENLKNLTLQTKEELEEISPLSRDAIEHANLLMEQAATLDSLLADTRGTSEAALKAATAYGNIVDAINDAFVAAEAAIAESINATRMSEGVADRAEESKRRSSDLLGEALKLQRQVGDLEPLLDKAKNDVLLVAQQNKKTSRGLDIINKDLDKFPLNTLNVLAEIAANASAEAGEKARRASDKIQDIVDKLPEDKEKAEQLPKLDESAREAVRAAHSYVDKVSTTIVPDTSRLMDRVSRKGSSLRITGTDVADKLAKLQQKVALARNQANRIKLGVQFFDNTTLRVRNPEGMQKAATYTHMSLYFKTTAKQGLLAYVGSEKDDHLQMKRVRTDDYMALEIKDGRIVMTMDLGSGSQDIHNNAFVSDGRWHQIIVERTGKTCTLTVRTEDEEDSVVEGYLPGTYSVFNLDQQISKFYVGGIKDRSGIPDSITNYHFSGCMEELEFGKTPVGLWDFVQAENNFEGCAERDQLALLVPSNGLRFDGSGYVMLPRKKHNFASETLLGMNFKTYAREGLIFLIGKNNNFLSLELRDGHIVLKYNLGSGMAELQSEETYNNGEWHSLESSRVDKEGLLKVDGEEVASGTSTGTETSLSTTRDIYVGGFPGTHEFSGVTNVGFEGCIKDMQIGADLVDLNKNKQALGVVNGCPVTIARTVSFTDDLTGYVAMPRVNLEKFAQLTFKFKTVEEDGLIFYAANEDQSKSLSIALVNGSIVMSSNPGGEIRTRRDLRYNDKEWHYVSATKAANRMRLDIDDMDLEEIEIPVKALVKTTSPLYFGGVPRDYPLREEAVPVTKPFVGCIGDATVNNKFQNFADTQDREVASIASCPLSEPVVEPLPTFGPLPPTILPPEPSELETTEEPITTVKAAYKAPDQEEIEETTTEDTGPDPTPVGSCALPLPPRRDKSVKSADGIRFGNTPYSRQEFTHESSFMASILDNSTFALEFRTSMQSGVMFYVSGENHIDVVGLYMQDGKVIYIFNCGSGSVSITTQNIYNDGTWHRVVFSRNGQEGMLSIDDEEIVRGVSVGSASSMNVVPPFFIGGISEEAARNAKNNLKEITMSFPGCIRNVEAQTEVLTAKKRSLSQNVTGCSDMVEEGTFFSADGGHLILYDTYRVGQRVTITVDVKPRSLSGVLIAVHGRTDYLVLQMIDGSVKFSVDNGAGAIETVYTPTDNHELCDGAWHVIHVVKSNNVVTMSVDGNFANPGIGVGGVSSTDTNDPLYIGGLPNPSKAKGVQTTEQFAGCMRYLELNSNQQFMAQSRIVGQVTLNTCPTI